MGGRGPHLHKGKKEEGISPYQSPLGKEKKKKKKERVFLVRKQLPPERRVPLHQLNGEWTSGHKTIQGCSISWEYNLFSKKERAAVNPSSRREKWGEGASLGSSGREGIFQSESNLRKERKV